MLLVVIIEYDLFAINKFKSLTLKITDQANSIEERFLSMKIILKLFILLLCGKYENFCIILR